jgi:hypothetical protein
MKVKTREDALLHCFDLWLWLALNPDKIKVDCPIWKSNGGYLETLTGAHCPCCDYKCLIKNSWCSTHCPIKWKGGHCLENASEFMKYNDSTTFKARTKWALKIAELALDAL